MCAERIPVNNDGLSSDESSAQHIHSAQNRKIIHDLNNALTILLGNSRFLAKMLEDCTDVKDFAQDAATKVERMSRALEKSALLIQSLEKDKTQGK